MSPEIRFLSLCQLQCDSRGQHSAQITNVYGIHGLESTVHVYGIALAQQMQVVHCAEYNQSVSFTVISKNEVTIIHSQVFTSTQLCGILSRRLARDKYRVFLMFLR